MDIPIMIKLDCINWYIVVTQINIYLSDKLLMFTIIPPFRSRTQNQIGNHWFNLTLKYGQHGAFHSLQQRKNASGTTL